MKIKLTKFRQKTFDFECLVDGKSGIIDPTVSCAIKQPKVESISEANSFLKSLVGKEFETRKEMHIFKGCYLPHEDDFTPITEKVED